MKSTNLSFDDSFFPGDSLQLKAEVPSRSFGFDGTATPFRLKHEGWSGFVLLLCLLLAASLILRTRKKFSELVRGFFWPIPGKADSPAVDDSLRYSTRLVAVGLLTLAATVISFAYTQSGVEYYPFPETPYVLLAAFFLFWLAYFGVKRMLGDFVNWIFFRDEKIFTWRRAYTFLLVAEAVLFLILALVVVYLPVSQNEMSLMILLLVIIVKIVLLFKTSQIFFPKMYGSLHLIVYFCTLELMPLLVMQQILTNSDWLLTVKL